LGLYPEVRGRNLTLSCAGKFYALSGLNIGWVTGPADLVRAALAAKQWLTYTSVGPLQHAVAYGLEHEVGPDRYTGQWSSVLQQRSLHLNAGLAELGFEIHSPAAGYFTVVNTQRFLKSGRWPGKATNATELAFELPELAGVVAIPVGALCDNAATAEYLLRFAFCKRLEVLDSGLARLAAALL